MNKSHDRNTTGGFVKNADSVQKTGSNSTSPFNKDAPNPDGKQPTDDGETKHTSKEPTKEAFSQVTAKDAAMPAAGAAKGDDDAMSQPQPKKSTMDELKSLWKQQVSAAMKTWSKLTEDELQNIEGRTHKLIDLVQARYVITREESDKQVRSFFEKFMPSTPSADEVKGNWKQQVGAAKATWGKLTEDELLTTEGQEMQLAGLVQARYAIQRDEAEKQVKSFFAKHKS